MKSDHGKRRKILGKLEKKLPKRTVDLADKIARDIFLAGDGPSRCRRIQFKGGNYPDSETNQGGFCESALAQCIRKSLTRHEQAEDDAV